jgi:acetyltransferase-like isoleucine patch superfamily enzyme
VTLGWNDSIKKELAYCGEQVFIGHNVFFTAPSKVFLEDRVRIDPFTFVTTGLRVGSNSQICAFSMLGGGAAHTITLRGWNFIGYGSRLFCTSEDYSGDYGPVNQYWGNNKSENGDILLEKYAGIASEVMVFPNVVVPEGCCIGAKSFIHADSTLEPWTVMIGNPPVLHKKRNKSKVLDTATYAKVR